MNAACSPIAVKEFLAKIGPRRSKWGGGTGICVSGGPDSMALALLFSQAKQQLGNHKKLTAFIVDHQARKGSTNEANIVAERLTRLGITPEILRMEWPVNTTPSELTNFESLARIARYQMLAEAAIRANVRTLFLGHHQDDQDETMLMRLIRTPEISISGLEGIRKHSPIPCCHGIYGAFEGYPYPSSHKTDKEPVRLASRKISLSRPLLDFPKSRLLATCQANNVPYFTDETNMDRTANLRSAIRYLTANYKLPRALQEPSLSTMRSKIARRMETVKIGDSGGIWNLVRVIKFELRTGTLVVALPKRLNATCEEPVNSAIWLLKNLLDAISPHSRDEDHAFISAEAIFRIFPSIGIGPSMSEGSPPSSPFTIGGVLIQPLARLSSSGDHESLWRLCREPFRASEQNILEKPLIVPAGTSIIESGMWSDWLLWDGRFWIRVRLDRLKSPVNAFIRPYRKSDVPQITESLRLHSPEALVYFQSSIRDVAPGKERYTLPVIADSEQVLAFPTLDILIPDQFRHTKDKTMTGGTIPEQPSWEVLFKSQGNHLTDFVQQSTKD